MDILEYLHFFGLESDHPAMRGYLTRAMSSISDLKLDQIALLSTIVFSMKTTKVTTLLRQGLRVVAKHFFPKDIPILSMPEKVSLLSLLGEQMEEQFQSRLLKAIEDEIFDIKYASAITLLLALDHLTLENRGLVNECLDKILLHIESLPVADAKQVTDALSGLGLYSPEFLNRLADESCKEDSIWTTMDLVTLVTNCRQQGHSHSKLLSHFAGYNGDAELTSESRFEIIQYFLDCRHDVQNNAAITGLVDELSTAVLKDSSLGKTNYVNVYL